MSDRHSDLRDRHETVISLSQQGYSHSGIAKEVGVTESTARKYLREIEEALGIEPLIDF